MSWKQLVVEIDAGNVESISDWLSERSALAVTYEDAKDVPILEPAPGETPLWDSVILTALFETDVDLEIISSDLICQFEKLIQTIKSVDLEDQQWERVWMDDFKPMQFGEKLWVCPSWEEIPNPDAVNLILDPGLAFGSGTHETTALCLEWLEAEDLSQKIVIDYGCGSGILGIAAVKLGAKKVIGADNDPQAMTASRANAIKNQISEEQFELILVNSEITPEMRLADVLIANILAEPLRFLAKALSAKLCSGGKLALSGLLAEQANEIMEIYQQWFDFSPVKLMGDWCLLSAVKR